MRLMKIRWRAHRRKGDVPCCFFLFSFIFRPTRLLSMTLRSSNWSCLWSRRGESLFVIFTHRIVVCLDVFVSPSNQCGDKDSARVEVSRAAGELLWHVAEEDSPQQETHLRGNWAQTQRSGSFMTASIPFDVFCPVSIMDFTISFMSLQLLVLKYVQNKDVFMRYHKAHLTRRLILDISADSEIEENMVEWLRVSRTFLRLFKDSDVMLKRLCAFVVGGRNACWLCEQARQDVSGHQGLGGPQSGLQRDAQTQQAGSTRYPSHKCQNMSRKQANYTFVKCFTTN